MPRFLEIIGMKQELHGHNFRLSFFFMNMTPCFPDQFGEDAHCELTDVTQTILSPHLGRLGFCATLSLTAQGNQGLATAVTLISEQTQCSVCTKLTIQMWTKIHLSNIFHLNKQKLFT